MPSWNSHYVIGVTLKCEICQRMFHPTATKHAKAKREGRTVRFCGTKCHLAQYGTRRILIPCTTCEGYWEITARDVGKNGKQMRNQRRRIERPEQCRKCIIRDINQSLDRMAETGIMGLREQLVVFQKEIHRMREGALEWIERTERAVVGCCPTCRQPVTKDHIEEERKWLRIGREKHREVKRLLHGRQNRGVSLSPTEGSRPATISPAL